MSTEAPRTGLAVAAREAEAILAPWRSRYPAGTGRRGLPTHLTVLSA